MNKKITTLSILLLSILALQAQVYEFSEDDYDDRHSIGGTAGNNKPHEIVDTLCQGLAYQIGTSFYKVTGIYTDSLISSLGCDSIVVLDLTIVPDQEIQADITYQFPTCYDYSDGSFSIENIRNNYLISTIYVDGVQQETNSYNNLPSGIYQVRIEDAYGCSFEYGAILENPERFELDLGEDQIIALGESTSVELITNYSLQSLVCTASQSLNIPIEEGCLEVPFFPSASGVYRATAVSEAGCMATDSVQVLVREAEIVYFPTAFSPNNDGINDFFSIYGSEPSVQRILSLEIYNRWGNLVFENNDFPPNDDKAGWAGYIKNSPAESETYVYLAEVEFLGGKKSAFRGEFALWR